MIAQLTVFQCQQDMAQPGLGVPALGNNLALDRLAGLSSPLAPGATGLWSRVCKPVRCFCK
jgi:hypothetical protein